MNIGALVQRKPEWGGWVKHNPWMLSEKDLEIGMIIETDVDLVFIYWPSIGPSWEKRDNLLTVNVERCNA